MSIWGNPVMLGKTGGGGLHGDMPPTSDIGSDGDIYTQVYTDSTLTGDGASYINTVIYPSSRFALELVAALTQTVPDSYQTLFGTRNGSVAQYSIRFGPINSAENGYLGIQKSNSPTASAEFYASTALSQNTMLNQFHKISFGFDLSTLNFYYAEDGTQKNTYDTSGNSNTFPYSWYLFGLNYTGSTDDTMSHMALKSFKAWDNNNNIVGYFVPYLDGNTPCALNLVTGTKHYNLGTGDFTYTATGTVKVGLVWLKENGAWSIIGHS